MTTEEIKNDYEWNTGAVIVDTFKSRNISMTDVPGVLVHSHGPFAWDTTPTKAVKKAVILEEVAKIAYYTKTLAPNISNIQQDLLDKHFLRKHGKDAYYGQK